MTKSMAPSSLTQRSAAVWRDSNWCDGEVSMGCGCHGCAASSGAYTPDVYATEAEDAGARPDFGDLLCGGLGLLNIAADDAGISSEVYKSPGLSRADGARAAGDEEDAVGCNSACLLAAVTCRWRVKAGKSYVPKMPLAQTLLRYSDLGTDILSTVFCAVSPGHKQGS